MTNYVKTSKVKNLPRIPLEGSIDLTYRCNNNCRHCWLRIPANSPEKENELTFDEIRGIVDEARMMGCRKWSISGGEPLLRSDFIDIFDYITSKSVSYSINTNGSLITQKIAKRLKKKGVKMVALYGGNAEVHDHITRTPGSFEAAMQGFAYLKEASAGFIVQVVPMRDNFHQYKEMVKLAKSLSPVWRIGAPWLYLSADGDPVRNKEISRQRLDPKDVVTLDEPDISYEERRSEAVDQGCPPLEKNDYFFKSCIESGRDFHIDPYGQMSFCSFIKDPSLRFDLTKGNFRECWDSFMPSLANKVLVCDEYKENCGSCDLSNNCHWCPVYGYLEHRNYQSKVEYLCDVAAENRKFTEDWEKNHRRYYQIGGMTIQMDSDLPVEEGTFAENLKCFEVDGPSEDSITIRHHFSLPDIKKEDLGIEVYRNPPWAIYKKGKSWIYLGISSEEGDTGLHKVAVFNEEHTRAKIYSENDDIWKLGNINSISLFPTDQTIIARVLANKWGFYLHSSGVVINGQGLLFVGHSEAGKSTMVKMLKDSAEILCDDRIILRKWDEGWKIHGTWSHGEVPDVSAGSAPLRAIMFLEKSEVNSLIPVEEKKEIIKRLLACVIRPFITPDWWEKTIDLMEDIASEIPCHRLRFDKSGNVIQLLKKLEQKELANRQ